MSHPSIIRLTKSLITISILFMSGLAFTQTESTASGPEQSIGIIYSEALQLVQSDQPGFPANTPQNVDPQALADLGFEQVYPNTKVIFKMRDGKQLVAFDYPQKSKTTVLLLHGVLSSAYMMNKTAGLIRDATQARVIALDLRGHGQSDGAPGDVDYVDQYVDDIADVIATIQKETPDGEIILAGHSMGGGISLRYAQRLDLPPVDGYLLLAPHLGQNSPTLFKESTEQAPAADNFLKVHGLRIIGLKVLNLMQDHQYDHLPVLFFNLPEGMPLRNYSYRASESMSPSDYKSGLLAVQQPLLVLVGSQDEAFTAEAFPSAIESYSKGEIQVIKGLSHNGIRHSEKAMNVIARWSKEQGFNK